MFHKNTDFSLLLWFYFYLTAFFAIYSFVCTYVYVHSTKYFMLLSSLGESPLHQPRCSVLY